MDLNDGDGITDPLANFSYQHIAVQPVYPIASSLLLEYLEEASFAMLCSGLLTKFYLGEARATISEETLLAGDEFEFTYMQSFKRRISVRKLRAQLMVRTESHYKTEVGADGEMGWMDEIEDKVLQEAQRPGWQAQPGEWSNDNAVFQLPDSALLSDIWLIKVHMRLNRLLMLERNYRLRVTWRR